ncbi:MAG: phosphopentomutase [Lachnospiraceae bacterium]|nr:phosphopentomutase [Lachnospiraceae bacterium]
MGKRVIIIVLDSAGIGEMPDSPSFGDVGVNTLRSCSESQYFSLPNMGRLGLFNIDGAGFGTPVSSPEGVYCKCAERSMGKDTTIGHWEIAGLVTPEPLPLFPDGFPEEILAPFREATGRGVLCNKPYSGTDAIADFGDEHRATGKLIVYTSADSVFQIAAHEEDVPPETLYEYCRAARKILTGKYGVARVIARPFEGTSGNYKRTTRRHDFSLEPSGPTLLDVVKEAGQEVLAVGKIFDIFAGRGITDHVYTAGNAEGIERTLEWMDRDFTGLLFTNLVDYDMLYGHRRDVDGYAKALTFFDERLPEILSKLRDGDILMITADHGCDPAYTKTTDHTREYVPLLMTGKGVAPENAHVRETYADIAKTAANWLGIEETVLAGRRII